MGNASDDDDGLSTVDDFVQIYMISLDIIGAHDLEKADVFGKSDPFCRVSPFSTSYTTCTIVKTLNPVWNEHVELTFFNDPKSLKFEVFDWDGNTKDDPIGDCKFMLDSSIYDVASNGFSGKIKLENCKKGELEIKIVARKLLPNVIEQKLTDLQDQKEKNEDSIKGKNGEIQALNEKNTNIENEINALNANINQLQTENIPNAQNELNEKKEEVIRLNAEQNENEKNLKDLDAECNDLAKEQETLSKQLEDIKIAEDKKKTENEHLKKDIDDLKKRINERKERLEKERLDQEKAEKERLKKDESEQKTEEKMTDIRVDAPRKESSSTDAKSPLVNKSKSNNSQSGCACCTVL